jgi:hypothetical protein
MLKRVQQPWRSADVEFTSLETDVVRFIAVVGLTLMVVFALVQALPFTGDVSSAGLSVEAEPTPGPLAPIPELATVPAAPSGPDRAALERELAAVEESRARIAAELAQARLKVEAMEAQFAETSRQLHAAEEQIESRQEELAADEEVRDLVQQLQVELSDLHRRLRDASPSESTASAEELAARPDAEPLRSLILRFKDDDVYLDLLARNRIQSFLELPGLSLTYQVLSQAAGKLRFSLVYDERAGPVYRIPDQAVPRVLRDQLRSFDLKLALRKDVVFLVTLSDSINEQVARLEAEGQVGYFEILSSEEVVATERR